MAYLTQEQLDAMHFKYLGKNVKISDKASIYDAEKISIGDNSRIDDFCVISGNLTIGKYCHITPMCLVAGGIYGGILEDYVTLAYGVKVFSQSDDYSGATMTNSLIPKKYKKEVLGRFKICKYSIVGAGSTIMPNVVLEEGTAVGSMSLILKSTKEWGIYVGVPARRLKERKRDLLRLVSCFEEEL